MVNFNRIKNKLKYTPQYKEIDLNDGENPIKIITNPLDEKKDKIMEIIIKNSKNQNRETKFLDLSKKEIFVPITKIITDIKFNDIQEENMFMDYLFKEPSKEAEILRDEILKVTNEIIDNVLKQIDEVMNNVTPDEMEKIMNYTESK